MTKTNKIIAAAAFALAFSSAPAAAGEPVAQVEVSYADLNLSSQSGQDILESRIRNAVKQVCGGPAQPNITFGRPVRDCMKQARAAAMEAHELAVANYKTQRLAMRERKVRFAIR